MTWRGNIWQALSPGRAGSLAASDERLMAVQLQVAALRAAQGGNGERRRAGLGLPDIARHVIKHICDPRSFN